jgi:Mrp family chromosome partitioning ATPase
MTRLSDALRKAAVESAATPVTTTAEPAAPAAAWQFAPVETMHVPDEPEVAGYAFAPSVSAPAPPAALRRDIRVGESDRSKLVIDTAVHPTVVEQYRHLAAVLHHAQKASGVRSVMVTSAMASEGKTLTATNLALTLSQSYQRRVLLVDADLRRPRMREMFALPATEGLTDSLASNRGGKLPVHQITPTLWVLTSGRVAPDPMSLLV